MHRPKPCSPEPFRACNLWSPQTLQHRQFSPLAYNPFHIHVCVHLLKNQTTKTLYTPKPNLSKNACIQERSGPSPWPPASHQELAPANIDVSMTRDRNLCLAPQPKSFMKTNTERSRHCPQTGKERKKEEEEWRGKPVAGLLGYNDWSPEYTCKSPIRCKFRVRGGVRRGRLRVTWSPT